MENKCWCDCGEIGTALHCLLKCYEKVWWFLKKLNRIAVGFSTFTQLYVAKKLKTGIQTHTCMSVFIVRLFTIGKM